jgi:hypothetical protein
MGEDPRLIPSPQSSTDEHLPNSQCSGWSGSRFAATAQRLSAFADSLIDPANEGDPFYHTIVLIHRYFNGCFSMITILSFIHFHAGNIQAAVIDLSSQTSPVLHEELEFDFRTVKGEDKDRSPYFSY